jgi:hypothetical protein
MIETVTDRLEFLSTTRSDILAEVEFVASHFDDFFRRPGALKTLPISVICEIIGHVSIDHGLAINSYIGGPTVRDLGVAHSLQSVLDFFYSV